MKPIIETYTVCNNNLTDTESDTESDLIWYSEASEASETETETETESEVSETETLSELSVEDTVENNISSMVETLERLTQQFNKDDIKLIRVYEVILK